MKRNWVKILLIVVGCVLLDIALHTVTSKYGTMPENPNYSAAAKLLGTEVTVTIWALLAFSGAAYVYLRFRSTIPGAGVEKGLRYGSAIALLWLFAMLEGVSLFGNGIINEFVVGLSDAIPIFLLGVLLSLLRVEKVENPAPGAFTPVEKLGVVATFAAVFTLGRYLAYFSGVIGAGQRTNPFYTLFWTVLMGAVIGVAALLLGGSSNKSRSGSGAAKFGLIFALNWATFLLFMPLLFSGYSIDALCRLGTDIVLVSLAYPLAFNPRSIAKRVSVRPIKSR